MVVNGLYERFSLCHAALLKVPGVVVFSFVELKPTAHVRGDRERAFGTPSVGVPNRADIKTLSAILSVA